MKSVWYCEIGDNYENFTVLARNIDEALKRAKKELKGVPRDYHYISDVHKATGIDFIVGKIK